ncbi:DNA repair protein RadA [candidate division WOR-3 bacterium]|nr:DNA repair protein RadA [candidate division WOR-3 bacterium]
MKKVNRDKFVCSNCGETFTRWQGSCPSCGAWDTVVESKEAVSSKAASSVKDISAYQSDSEKSITGVGEFDRVLGGGFIPGSAILISGEPGIGKSTFILQVADSVANFSKNALYITAEESMHQLLSRAKRIGSHSENLKFVSENDANEILKILSVGKYDAVILDSVQTVFNPAIESITGSVNQVRSVSEIMCTFARKTGSTVFLIGQVTKSGDLAGPRSLEHLVDVVLSIEGDRRQEFRILRSYKNRYGSTDEIGIFKMTEKGFEEIKDATEILLDKDKKVLPPGTIRGSVIEGNRSFIVEVESLTVPTKFGVPARVVNGFNQKRLSMLLAVLDKWQNADSGSVDIYCNIAGGLHVSDTALDLSIALAVVSSYSGFSIPANAIAFGEMSLSGDIRPVKSHELRIKEAKRLGYETIIVPQSKIREGIPVKNISEAVKVLKDLSAETKKPKGK